MRHRILLSAYVLCVTLPALVGAQQTRMNIDPVRVDVVAEKLGVKLMPTASRELEGGQSATATLADPRKIEPYGIKGVHEGARVTITCVGPNRLRVEADEYEPVEKRSIVTLHVGEDGALTQVADRPPPA